MGNTVSLNRTIRFIRDRLHWIILLILILWSVFPLIWAFSATFKTYAEVYKVPPTLIPHTFNFNNYIRVFQSANFFVYLYNSIFVTIISAVISVTVSILAGYGFARYKFKMSGILLMLILIPRIIPRASLIIPLFRMMSALRLLDSFPALIITYTATAIPLNTMVLSGYFKTIPKAIEEAAMIDGAKPWQKLLLIVLPMSLPALITAGVMSLREGWNEFPFVLALTTSTKMRTLPYQLFMLRDSMGIEDWPVVLAFTFLTILPILIIYLIFQRKVVDGLVSGAIK